MAASLEFDDTSRGWGRRFTRGWVLLLLLCVAPMAAAQDWNYRIRPGDTLWNLAGEYLKPGIAWQRLQAHNQIANPYQLPPGTTLRFPLAWLNLQPVRAKVVAVRGAATVSGVANAGPVVEGMELGIGALLHTTSDATLSLQFADGSRLLLQGDSELRLDRLSRYGKSGMVDTRLRLQRGRITNDVVPTRGASPAFIVDTPNASSAVRGTRFRINATGERSQAEVTQGSVLVSANRRSALVRDGHGTVVAEGASTSLRAVALLPPPDLSGLPASLNGARGVLQWSTVAGSVGYRVLISNTDTFDTLLVDATTGSPQFELPVLPPGACFLRIRAIDASGLEGRDGTARFVAEAYPDAPMVISPTARSTLHDPQPDFHWATIPEVAQYHFELAAEPGFEHPIARLQAKPSSLRLPQALSPGDYFWRIASEGVNGNIGPFSDPVPLSFQALPEAGQVESESGRTRDVTFHWREGMPGQRYRFQLSRSPDFAKKRIDQVVTESQITMPKLPAGTWYLRAQAIGEDGYEAPMPPAQQVKVPCGICKVIAGGGMLWILLAL